MGNILHCSYNTFNQTSAFLLKLVCVINFFVIVEIVDTQEQLWRDSVSDSPAIEEDARRGGITSRSVNPIMISEIQKLVSRLVCKASQLITNETTNMAESWMHVRCKYDGGKVTRNVLGKHKWRAS